MIRTSQDAVIAMTRFGNGIAPGQIGTVVQDPKKWLKDQTAAKPSVPSAFDGLPTVTERLDSYSIVRGKPDKSDEELEERRIRRYKLGIASAEARVRAAIDSDMPLHERLVRFWADHFTVSTLVGGLVGMVDVFENEAIRPHILGRFRDMLGASTHHPFMLIYLDNAVSIGPNSPAGKAVGKGLNENFARELMELHTLGVNGGYTQADVRNLAKMLTGWTVTSVTANPPFAFQFMPSRHEPGDKTLLGQVVREAGMDEVDVALDRLASAPETARHLARKMATHFVSDNPDPALIAVLERQYLETDGDLGAMTRALIDHPAAWRPEPAKVLLPEDWAIALAVLIGADSSKAAGSLVTASSQLGQRIYATPSPKGWPGDVAAWLTAESVIARSYWARRIALDLSAQADPRDLIAYYGMPSDDDVARAITGAPSQADGIALIAASPMFNLR